MSSFGGDCGPDVVRMSNYEVGDEKELLVDRNLTRERAPTRRINGCPEKGPIALPPINMEPDRGSL